MSILQRHPFRVGAIVILSAAAALFLLDMLSRDHSPHDDLEAAQPADLKRFAGPADIPSRPLFGRFEPRRSCDASGYTYIIESIEPLSPSAALVDVRAAWMRAGQDGLKKLEHDLSRENLTGPRLIAWRVMQSTCLSYDGESQRAYDVVTETRSQVEADPSLAEPCLYTLIYLQGLYALRRGETENCVMCRGESSCILPIAPSAVHVNPEGSRLAIRHFTEYLAQFPDDLEVRWLLNLAHMTLGEYPAKVAPDYLVPLDRWSKSEFNVGRLRDVGHLVGVNRFNQAGGGILDDFDNDGRLDLVLSTFDPTQPMAYLRNDGQGNFLDESKRAGMLDQVGGGEYCVQGDYDNDGLLDVFIPRGTWIKTAVRPTLLHNEGGGRFSDVTEATGLAHPLNSGSATWGDYDNDGWLDLFVCCERQPCCLYRNLGNGRFEELAEYAGVQQNGLEFCKGSAWIDYDNDNDIDLFVINMHGFGRLFENQNNGKFIESSESLGIDGPKMGYSCWAWDYDNDGWLDIFANSYDRTTADIVKGLMGIPHDRAANKLYHNLQGQRFEDNTKSAGLDLVFAAMGGNFGDIDNDGFLDIYLGTGDPDISTLVPNRMFKNVAGRRFAEISASTGMGHLQKGHSVSFADWDRDGDLDVFIEVGGATPGDRYHNVMFQNPGQGNHWLSVKLVGKKTNRSAIGARIKATTTGEQPLTLHRHVTSGSSFGANPLEQHLGLGQAKQVALLEIHWPTSDTTQVFRNLSVDKAIEITEFAEDYKTLEYKAIPLPKE